MKHRICQRVRKNIEKNNLLSHSSLNNSEKNFYDQIYQAEKLEQEFARYKEKNMEQILKDHFSQDDRISEFYRVADAEDRDLERSGHTISVTSSNTSNDSNVAKQFDDPLELFAHIQKMASKEDGPPIEAIEEESGVSQSLSEVNVNRESSNNNAAQINLGRPNDGSYIHSLEISRRQFQSSHNTKASGAASSSKDFVSRGSNNDFLGDLIRPD